MRRRAVRIQIAGVDTTEATDRIDKGQCRRSLRRRSGHGIRDPRYRHHEAGVDRRDHEHHAQIAGGNMRRRRGDDVRHDGDAHGDGDVEVSLARLVGVPGVGEGDNDSQNVGRRGEQEGVNPAVAEGLDDGGEEIGDGAGGDDAEEEDHLLVVIVHVSFRLYHTNTRGNTRREGGGDTNQDISPEIRKRHLSPLPKSLLLSSHPIIHAHILF